MNRRRPLFSPVVLSLLVGIMGGLVWEGASALPASANTLLIPFGGTVDGLPESVSFSGLAQIKSRLVLDPDFGRPPAVVLSIDYHSVSGQGLSTGATYVTSDNNELIRPLVASDVIELTFPFYPNAPGGILSARSGLASFSLKFDVRTGNITDGTVTITTPNFAAGP